MSQAGLYDDSATPLSDIETLTGDSGGAVGPNGSGNIDIKGVDSTTNNDNGITIVGTPGSNLLDVTLTNRATGAVTTTDATLTTIITLPMGATPSTFYILGNICCFNASNPASGAYSIAGGYRTDGATSVELGTEYHDTFEDPALSGVDVFLTSSGNDILVQVQGVGVLSINWNAVIEYRQVT